MADVQKFSLFTDDALKEALMALELALLSGAQQVTFLGQTVLYTSDSQKRKTIDEVTQVLCNRGALPDAAKDVKTKRISIQTNSSGF